MSLYSRGDIILGGDVVDPAGYNPKDRPCLVIDVIESSLYCVAITTSFQPGEAMRVELPWARPRHPRTGLWERCAAACDWYVLVEPEQVIEKLGQCPGKRFLEVIKLIDAQA